MVKAVLMVAMLTGCSADDIAPAPDAAERLAPDACTREPTEDCCALLPDENAVRACVVSTVNPGDCGVAVCWLADCSRVTVNFCAPI